MTTRICTFCVQPHETTDFYEIEPRHPDAGKIECRDAHETRVRRETRESVHAVALERNRPPSINLLFSV